MSKMCEPSEDSYSVSLKYRRIKKRLDNLGYKQSLPLDGIPLVEKLLADLIQTTESLKYFKSIAVNNIENSNGADRFSDPCKSDNPQLAQEYNQLSKELIETKESHLKVNNDLKRKINKLESECNDLQLASSKNLKRIKDLEIESSNKSKRIQELVGKCCKPTISNAGLATKRRTVFPLKKPVLEAETLSSVDPNEFTHRYFVNLSKTEPHIVDIVGMAEKKVNSLMYEVNKIKEELALQTDNVCVMKVQMAMKEKEISRLRKLVDSGRPYSIASNNCTCGKNDQSCTHCSSKSRSRHGNAHSSAICIKTSDVNQVRILQQAKLNLEQQLRDSLDKQHDAMAQAMKLAERNEELEKELKDIDNIALAVEADCDSTVKENKKKISQLQEKLENNLKELNTLENNLLEEKRTCQELKADLEAARYNKRSIQRTLDNALEDNRQLMKRINDFNIIESDLSNTINRLSKENHDQKFELVELRLLTETLNKQLVDVKKTIKKSIKDRENKDKSKSQNQEKSVVKKKAGNDQRPARSPTLPELSSNRHDESQRKIAERDDKIKQLECTIQRLEGEKNHYRDEWNKLRDQSRNPHNDKADLFSQICDLKHQLNEKEAKITELRREKTDLTREKLELEEMYKLQPQRNGSSRTWGAPSQIGSNFDDVGNRVTLMRLERERDCARADLERLKEERDIIRERLKLATEAHTAEQRRLRDRLRDMEIKLDGAERERQNILLSQESRQSALTELEDIREELRRSKQELASQRSQHLQLRALQEQTDQALGDVQNQLTKSESELSRALDRYRLLEQQHIQSTDQVKNLKQEINNIHCNMTRLHTEKDQLVIKLDEKTERIADLEREMMLKEQQMLGMEQQLREFQHRNQICVDQSAEQERRLRELQIEMENHNRQLSAASADREKVAQENRRYQDDLAALTCEIRNLQHELDESKKESYDVKKQLQTYVSEVRRAEQLLESKEKERTEMLHQFKNLSLEATVLENDKHSLESEAAEARGALQIARDRLTDIESDLADKNCLIQGYENKITELTHTIATLETEIRQKLDQRNHAERDLNAVRHLSVTLENQKDTYVLELGKKNAIISNLEGELSRLNAEYNINHNQTSRNQATIERLQSLLDEARRETIDQQRINQELRNEIERLRKKVNELQSELSNKAAELKRCQNQAAEYNIQVSNLRRVVTDERFNRAKQDEDQRRKLSYSPKNLQISPNGAGEVTAGYSTRSDLLNSPLHLDPSSSRLRMIREDSNIQGSVLYRQQDHVAIIKQIQGTNKESTIVKESKEIVAHRSRSRNTLESSSFSRINVPGCEYIHFKATNLEDDQFQNIILKITDSRNRIENEVEDENRIRSAISGQPQAMRNIQANLRSGEHINLGQDSSEHQHQRTPIRTPVKMVDFTPGSGQRGRRNERTRVVDIEACGCRRNEHLPGCRIKTDRIPSELFGQDAESDDDYPRERAATPEVNVLQPVRLVLEPEEESVDVFADSEDDDEVISPTPQRPRRRIRRPQHQPDIRSRRDEPASRSRDLIADSDEVIPDSRIHDEFPRRRRPRRTDPQAMIKLARQTIADTAMTFRQLSEVVEQKFDDISQMILNSAASFPATDSARQLHDIGIQYGNSFINSVEECSQTPWEIRVRKNTTETDTIEEQISATQVVADPRRDGNVMRHLTITTRVHEEADHERKRSRHVQLPKDDVIYSSLSYHSMKNAHGNQVRLTSETQTIVDESASSRVHYPQEYRPRYVHDDRTCRDWRPELEPEVDTQRVQRRGIRTEKKCVLTTCNNCRLMKMPTSLPSRIPTSTPAPSRPPAASVPTPEIITTPYTDETIYLSPPRSRPTAPSQPAYDVPQITISPADVSIVDPVAVPAARTAQSRRERGRAQRGDQHLQVPTHSYNLRPLDSRRRQGRNPTPPDPESSQHIHYTQNTSRRKTRP